MKIANYSYSEALERIEEILSILEEGDKGMDELSELVKEAAGLVKKCKSKLRMTEDEIAKAFEEGQES
jgi:exodeoxyribonuclease VII small subunit